VTPRIGRHLRVLVLACEWAIVVAAGVLLAQQASLTVERQGDRLHLSARHFHFLEGTPLEQLKNGAALPYVFSVTIDSSQGGGRFLRLQERFVISYDLWEEKFAVVQDGRPRRTVSHLTAAAAEAWCLDSLLPAVPAVPAEKTFVVKLLCSVVPEEEPQSGEGFSLSTLIDVFSRKGAGAPPRWELVSAPLRLADLKNRSQH
jgi:hypothetical protein